MTFRKDSEASPFSALILALLIVLLTSSPSGGLEPRSDQFLKAIQLVPGVPLHDGGVPGFERARADTIWYGGHDGSGYAVEGSIWDFEDGMGGPDWQGWYGVDQSITYSQSFYGKRVEAADFSCPTSAPIINAGEGNVGQIWFGQWARDGNQEEDPDAPFNPDGGDARCWICDAGGDCSEPETRVGYGNNVRDYARSPKLNYGGGDIQAEFLYFLDCEGGTFDFVRVQVIPMTPDEEEPILMANITGSPGIIGDPSNPAVFSGLVDAGQMPDTTGIEDYRFSLQFEFKSDGGWSDEDEGGGICSTYGPFAADSIVIAEDTNQLALYTFEVGDEGWTFGHSEGNGNFVDIHHVSEYQILDPCACGLEDWLLAFHDENYEHPGDPDGSGTGQSNAAVSPIIDRSAYPAPEWNDLFYVLDMYAWMPLNNGVLYRPGMFYYPWTCAESGASGWSPFRYGQSVWFYIGTDPVCFETYNNFVVDGLPGNADLYRIVFELLSCCACFGIGDNCTNETNETPLLDNIHLGVTGYPNAPVISLDTGGLQDIFAEDGTLNPSSTGRSDDAAGYCGGEPPYILSDSLGIAGPVVGGDTDPWEAFCWFRLTRKGPMQDTPAYSSWKTRLMSATFPGDPEVEFVGVRMDSSQLGSNAFANKYCTFAHPDDGFYQGDPEDDERSDLNEILPDRVFTPGTQMEYFITSRFIGETEMYFLPDTSDRLLYEYEILPSMRWSGEPGGSDIVWPCVLYWDAYNRGSQSLIEPVLNDYLQPLPGVGPNHDRYDELLASSCFNVNPIYRVGEGATNGGTLEQLLAYQVMLLNTGRFTRGAMEPVDALGIEDWLEVTACGASSRRQGFIANGDNVAGIIENLRPSLLHGLLGTEEVCTPYYEADCPPGTPYDPSYCVAVIDAPGGSYPSTTPYYAFGNGCPNLHYFSVLYPTAGTGNRQWWDYDGGPGGKGVVSFAQVVNDMSGGDENFRSVVDGYSYDVVTTTFLEEEDECVPDWEGRVEAAGNEIITALDWIFDGNTPTFCMDICPDPSDVPDMGGEIDVKVNRLYQNEPNPFNPRTAIRFSVAARGHVELSIYDIGGRLVRTLVGKPMDAGLHTVVWDGMDNGGHKVGSGIYWSQLRVGDYISNKKLVLLK